jgi:hypothetical protein
LRAKNTSDMHDSEPETSVLKTMPEIFSDKLKEIGIESRAKEIATDEVEKGDYYGRCFSQTPRMITNKGCLEIKGTNIDLVQIIQKG